MQTVQDITIKANKHSEPKPPMPFHSISPTIPKPNWHYKNNHEERRNLMLYTLMHRDIPVMDLELDEYSNKIGRAHV